MSFFSSRVVGFGQAFRSVILLIVLIGAISPPVAFGHTKRTKIRGFWVAGSAAVTVKADEAVVFMMIRGSGPLATEALAQNDVITQQVVVAIDKMGFEGKYRFSANHFNSGGAPALALRAYPSYPRVPQQSGCFEVTKYVFITFGEADLANPAFDQILAGTIDGLTRAGAQKPELPPQLAQTRNVGPVLFTVKDPGPALLEATHQAMGRAAALGQEVAKNSGVKLGSIIHARVNRPLEVSLPRQQELNLVDELHLQYYSTSKDGVTIPATFAVEYSTK